MAKKASTKEYDIVIIGSGSTRAWLRAACRRGGKKLLMVASLRYSDTFAKTDGTWPFAERPLYVD
jgi:hypothetical protein